MIAYVCVYRVSIKLYRCIWEIYIYSPISRIGILLKNLYAFSKLTELYQLFFHKEFFFSFMTDKGVKGMSIRFQ